MRRRLAMLLTRWWIRHYWGSDHRDGSGEDYCYACFAWDHYDFVFNAKIPPKYTGTTLP